MLGDAQIPSLSCRASLCIHNLLYSVLKLPSQLYLRAIVRCCQTQHMPHFSFLKWQFEQVIVCAKRNGTGRIEWENVCAAREVAKPKRGSRPGDASPYAHICGCSENKILKSLFAISRDTHNNKHRMASLEFLGRIDFFSFLFFVLSPHAHSYTTLVYHMTI